MSVKRNSENKDKEEKKKKNSSKSLKSEKASSKKKTKTDKSSQKPKVNRTSSKNNVESKKKPTPTGSVATTRKKTSSISRNKRKEIKEAAASIESMILEEVNRQENGRGVRYKQTSVNSKYGHYQKPEYYKKMRLRTIGVGVIAALLLITWVVNTRGMIITASQSNLMENGIIGQVKDDVSAVISDISFTKPVDDIKKAKADLLAATEGESKKDGKEQSIVATTSTVATTSSIISDLGNLISASVSSTSSTVDEGLENTTDGDIDNESEEAQRN